MNPGQLIPQAEAIPASATLIWILNLITFAIHILLVNIVLGSSIIMLYERKKKKKSKEPMPHVAMAAGKVPSVMALAINFGVAPLLFLQVLYGNFFYTSSILMGMYWISVVLLLLIAYYGLYGHSKFFKKHSMATLSLAVSVVTILVIAFFLVNNNTLMAMPEAWATYFSQRKGTILNLSYSSLWPRYLHFLVASVAVGGLFKAFLSHWQKRKNDGYEKYDEDVARGLKIFTLATGVQALVGLWYFLSLPALMRNQFLGDNLFYTVVFCLGVCLALGSILLGAMKKLILTLGTALGTILLMVLTRANLRTIMVGRYQKLEELPVEPQYAFGTVFFVFFAGGIALIAYMIKISFSKDSGRSA